MVLEHYVKDVSIRNGGANPRLHRFMNFPVMGFSIGYAAHFTTEKYGNQAIFKYCGGGVDKYLPIRESRWYMCPLHTGLISQAGSLSPCYITCISHIRGFGEGVSTPLLP